MVWVTIHLSVGGRCHVGPLQHASWHGATVRDVMAAFDWQVPRRVSAEISPTIKQPSLRWAGLERSLIAPDGVTAEPKLARAELTNQHHVRHHRHF